MLKTIEINYIQPFNRDALYVRRYASPYFNDPTVINNNGVTQPRRELYVTLISGNFSKGNKTREHNIEVEVNVVDSNGNWVSIIFINVAYCYYLLLVH